MKYLMILSLVAVFAVNSFAQTETKKQPNSEPSPKVIFSKNSAPLDVAKAALGAHGGDKFKNMKSLVVSGTADVSGSPTMTFPAPFIMTLAADKYRLEISTPFLQFKQIYDGEQTVSSSKDFSLPPINRLGLPLLPKIGEKDFIVAALPENKKKKLGFRITSPEGYYTDFFVDEKTGQIKSYEASYEFNNRTITTSVEIDKLREVEGVKIPERYAQRFEMGGLTVYVNFKAKEIAVNSTIADDVFTMK